MPLPPKGDPSRPVFLAARSMMLLGGIQLALGGLVVTTVLLLEPRVSIIASILGIFYSAPGVLYLVFAMRIRKNERWAATGGMILALIHVLLMLLWFLAPVVISRGRADLFEPLRLLFAVLFIAAFSQLAWHCAKARTYINGLGRGFEPIMPPQDLPVARKAGE